MLSRSFVSYRSENPVILVTALAGLRTLTVEYQANRERAAVYRAFTHRLALHLHNTCSSKAFQHSSCGYELQSLER